MARLSLSLFGGFHAASESGHALDLKAKKLQALLAYLALNPNGCPRATVAGLLWSEVGDKQASDSLRQARVTLRSALAAIDITALVSEGAAIRLDAAAVDADVVAFERLVTRGTP